MHVGLLVVDTIRMMREQDAAGVKVVRKPEECAGCRHLENKQGGHCYMFLEFFSGCRLHSDTDPK